MYGWWCFLKQHTVSQLTLSIRTVIFLTVSQAGTVPLSYPSFTLDSQPSVRFAHHLYPRWNTRHYDVRRWSNMELRGHRAGKSSSFQEVACHMMGLISQCCRTQSWVFALSNSGTGLETRATSLAISQSCTEAPGRTEILLAHFIHIMYMLFCQAFCMEMRSVAIDTDSIPIIPV